MVLDQQEHKKVLHLTLHKKWFDQIALGIKIEEYRDVKPYWSKRLDNKEYDEIYFRNGYSKTSPFMIVEWKGCERKGDQYIIHLGKIIKIERWDKAKTNLSEVKRSINYV